MVVAEDHFKTKVADYLKENGYGDTTPMGGPCTFEHKETLYIHGEGEKTSSITKKKWISQNYVNCFVFQAFMRNKNK